MRVAVCGAVPTLATAVVAGSSVRAVRSTAKAVRSAPFPHPRFFSFITTHVTLSHYVQVGIEEWSDDSISHFVDCGCLPAVAELLCCTDRQVLAIVMSGLQFLAARDPTHRLLIANCAGVQSGLPLLLEHRDPHIVESALELIQAVAADSDFL